MDGGVREKEETREVQTKSAENVGEECQISEHDETASKNKRGINTRSFKEIGGREPSSKPDENDI